MNVTQRSKSRTIIDCDPGLDDAIALMLAFGALEELDILGVTTVGGNVGIELTQRNARMVCDMAGRTDVKVYAGCGRPMVRQPVVADYYHGVTGMGGIEIFKPSVELTAEHAVNFMIRTLMSEPEGSVTLACLAPLTNVAMALVMEPRIAGRIREIVFMGGAQKEGGNTTPTSSFNVFCDPHALHVVLNSGVPVVLVNLDVTHQLVMTPPRLEAILSIGTPAAKLAIEMLTWDHERRLRNYGAGAEGLPVSDLSVVAYILDRTLFSGRMVNVEVDLVSPLTMGMTVVDFWGFTDRSPNALWLQHTDADGVFLLLVNCLKSLTN
jgi:purine nucleosidase